MRPACRANRDDRSPIQSKPVSPYLIDRSINFGFVSRPRRESDARAEHDVAVRERVLARDSPSRSRFLLYRRRCRGHPDDFELNWYGKNINSLIKICTYIERLLEKKKKEETCRETNKIGRRVGAVKRETPRREMAFVRHERITLSETTVAVK